jgi:hypothetical protein
MSFVIFGGLQVKGRKRIYEKREKNKSWSLYRSGISMATHDVAPNGTPNNPFWIPEGKRILLLRRLNSKKPKKGILSFKKYVFLQQILWN